MDLDDTSLAMQLIRSSADRCFAATGSKCQIVFISKAMYDDIDPFFVEAFGDMLILDNELPGWGCYARAPIKI